MNIKMRITEEESTFNNPESTPEEKLAARDRIDDLRMAIDTINTQRIMEEYEFGLNEELESDYGRYERFKEWAKDNLLGLSAIAITISGIITTIVLSTRTVVTKGAQATSALAKKLAAFSEKVGPYLAPLITLLSKGLVVGGKLLAWLARNLWVLAVATVWFLRTEFDKRRSKRKVR